MRRITNMASVAIIYRKKQPEEIFIEKKDGGHPVKLVRHQLCPIGGNWIGQDAKFDKTPLDTLRRELEEELTLYRPMRTTHELELLGLTNAEVFSPTTISSAEITGQDQHDLGALKKEICKKCTAFGAYLNTVSRKALDSADPANRREGFTALGSYYTVALNEEFWEMLVRLQEKFHNLSSDALTVITSLTQILATGTKFAFGHDRVFQEFFLKMGFSKARHLLLVDGIKVVLYGRMCDTYEEYLRVLSVEKNPLAIE